MAGAASVTGAVLSLARSGAPVDVVAIAALADGSTGSDVDITVTWTMPGGEARKYMTRSTIALSHTP